MNGIQCNIGTPTAAVYTACQLGGITSQLDLRLSPFFYPIELSGEEPKACVINTVTGDEAADHLIQYWVIKARRMLELIDGKHVPLSIERAFEALQHMLVIACSLVKNEGWRDEHEYRILYISENFGDEEHALCQRTGSRGRYVPVKWFVDKTHPLADADIVEHGLRVKRFR